ncbi:hypothetical protein M8848_10650 [Pasteurella multocida]|uniref:hypothetical protein n=1 Tax=Pasteurella multocida TaxID=747 RepID=UPI0020238687|nr:hypothetical protein [Pasteurella multocida]URH78097.1 hypothetical protein M8848_10650 [Pasteurella multocida]HDR1195231.1 hypothetical protein [Pasteurella multocida]HDR1270868.1 hypothetical protein [Pasteurella multocida]HDR1901708.1 hypothetical protein [Pasteurella multocida]HEA3286255.1 hypothetical protein [Pasteurella multocida]
MKVTLPQKDSYSLEELPAYLSKTYNLDVTHDDLITYSRKGKLRTCIQLEGNTKGIYSVGRIEINKENPLQLCTPPTAVFFNSVTQKSFLPNDLHLEDENIFFGARIPIFNAFYKEISSGNTDYKSAVSRVKSDINAFIDESTYIPQYEYQILLDPKAFDYVFSASFYLPESVYNTNSKLLDSHLIQIDFSDDSFYLLENTNRENIFINLALSLHEAPKIAVHFKQIEVLHSDLMTFLGVSDEPQKNAAEIHKEIEKLKLELDEKNNKITELQTALDNKKIPILLGKYRENDPLKIAIEVRNKYWADYPENVKSNRQIQDYIMRDYGITRTFATEIEKIACPIDRKKN